MAVLRILPISFGVAVMAGAQQPFPPAELLKGSPADHLPPHIKQLTCHGERPQFSCDRKRVLFMGAVPGEVNEMELTTGRIKRMTAHFRHHGFTRAFYPPNGDVLLSGPARTYDRTDADAREEARRKSSLFVLWKELNQPPVPLGDICSEGPAVSRKHLRIACTHRVDPYGGTSHFIWRGISMSGSMCSPSKR